jgi:hypothetical protein
VYGQRFDSSGGKVGDEFLVNQTTIGGQTSSEYRETVAVLADGTLVATWYGEPTFNSNEVYARHFTLPGVGAEDTAIVLPTITAALAGTDTDGSETLAIVLSDFPPGSIFKINGLQAGSVPADGPYAGKWLIDLPEDIAALATTPLTITPPLNFNGTINLTVQAVAEDTAVLSSGAASDTAESAPITVPVTVVPVNDAPAVQNETLDGDIAGFTYNPENGHWYKINTGALSWSAAQAAAIAAGGYLATITSLNENTFITDLLEDAALAVPAAWIGASDSDAEGEWRWAGGPEDGAQFWSGGPAPSGSPLMYANWRNNETYSEPNDSGGAEEHAYIMASGLPENVPGAWNDTPEAAALASVIEVSFVEDTASIIPAAFLLANDIDPEGDGVVIHGLPITDTAAGGSIQFTLDGDILYEPPENFSGLDSFEYEVRDSNWNISPDVATVTFFVSPGTFTSNTLTFDDLTAGQSVPVGYGALGPFDGFDSLGTIAINPDDSTAPALGLGIVEDTPSALISQDGTEFTIAAFTLGDLDDGGVVQPGLQSLTVYGYNGEELAWTKSFNNTDGDPFNDLSGNPGTPELLSGFSTIPVTMVEFEGALGQSGTVDNFVFTTVPSVRGTEDSESLYATPVGNRVIGYGGDDELHGNAGADTFVFRPGSDSDTIVGFDPGMDKIEIFDPDIVDFLYLQNNNLIEEVGGDTVIGHGSVGSDVITVQGVTGLTQSHFVLHQSIV